MKGRTTTTVELIDRSMTARCVRSACRFAGCAKRLSATGSHCIPKSDHRRSAGVAGGSPPRVGGLTSASRTKPDGLAVPPGSGAAAQIAGRPEGWALRVNVEVPEDHSCDDCAVNALSLESRQH